MRVLSLFLGLAGCTPILGFLPSSGVSSRSGVVLGATTPSHHDSSLVHVCGESNQSKPTRRLFVEKVLVGSIGLSVASSPAIASGGATAGGAYLLSAKQRYNNRVIAGVKAFLALDSRDLSQVDAFFSTTEEGGWEDLSGAGYLLANAFRTSSTKAPDNLPSVKASITKWKAFAKDVELLKKALSKKDGETTFAAYKTAVEKLDAYLEEVELVGLVR
eukprot:scaffold6_cov190-Alexandrium_tamarense.AAC.34